MQPKTSKFSFTTAIIQVVVSVMFCLVPLEASAQNAMSREHQAAKMGVTETRLRQQLSFLCDSLCQGRAFTTSGGAEAGFWIHREFERIGLMKIGTSYGKHVNDRHGKTGRNIVGMLPGSLDSTCDKYIIVGAHYDHLGQLYGRMYPGADANASGTVALINIAEMLKSLKEHGKAHSHNVIFIAFDGKEHDMAGSKAFWKMIEKGELKDPQSGKTITKGKISLMVNIDQIGSTLSPLKSGRKDYIIMLGNHSLTGSRHNSLKKCNSRFGIDMDIDYTYYGSQDFTRIFYRLSDQRVFVDNHIPAVVFTSGITMNTNKTWDTPENMDMEVFKKRISLIYHWIDMMMQ